MKWLRRLFRPKAPRVSWPPGYANDRPIRVVRHPNALYLIEDFASRRAALYFLRGTEVRDERVYVIAENPEGNLGRDLIMIFDEADGGFVEIGERSALPEPVRSTVDCARCGYAVIPADAPQRGDHPGGHVTVHRFLNLEDMEMGGGGFRCRACRALGCAACYRATLPEQRPPGELDLRCWMCGGAMDLFEE